MKLSTIATILLVLTGPAFAAEKRLVRPEPEHRRDWTILYNWQLTKDKTIPFYYWQQFDTEQECLDELHDLQKQGPKRVDIGVTQMGPKAFQNFGTVGGMTWDQYRNATAAQRIAAYGDWLDRYGGLKILSDLGFDISSQPPAMQAAILMSFQISPYHRSDVSDVRCGKTPF